MNMQKFDLKKFQTSKVSRGNIKEIKIPEKNERLAELIGIILGDGNIQYDRHGYSLRIVGDSIKDKEYLLGYVKPLCDSLFGVDSKVSKHRTFNELFIKVHRKRVLEFLFSVGLAAGDKIKSQETIPRWVFENDQYLKACIRGLVDTDGSIYELLPHWPGLWQICFTNRNDTLMNDFREGLIKVGIGCSKIYNYKDGKKTPKVYITKKIELGKFYKEIGFSNPKHRNKIAPSSSGHIVPQ